MAWADFMVRTHPKTAMILFGWTFVMMMLQLSSHLDGWAVLGMAVWAWLLVGVVFLGVLMYEYIRLFLAYRAVHDVVITRTLLNNLPVNERSVVSLSFYGADVADFMANFRCEVVDFVPSNTKIDSLPMTFLLGELSKEQGELVVSYDVYAHERGFGLFGGVDWRLTTPLGLLIKYHHTPMTDIEGIKDVRVLANFRAVLQGHLTAISRHSAIMGIIKKRRKGQGQDFHQIRAYADGDSIRQIDWKATSRHQRLMTKEYQDEADQEILFLLDCGQHMRHVQFDDDTTLTHDKGDNASHLDMALNAMLLLAQVANEQGDSTGFVSFGAVSDKIALPKKGGGVISYLLNQSFDLTASTNAPDYMAVAKTALATQKRRSLIIFITNIRTQSNDEIVGAIQLLSQKHRVIVANLAEQDLMTKLGDDFDNVDDALTYHGVFSHVYTQKQHNAELSAKTRAMVVGCTPQELPHRLIDAYWAVKKWGVA
ncbi:DUF58 domain-containing protein [Moraxella oblonga]|uniref:DUF58 domain-containing protein n=1 Tax=Moraxella oblonga TaxID=200413 RepID=UPI00082F079D|nr:DUF58 domain-containing protein [Moraxella oblonga]